jgi:serine/threonine protein kinase
MGAVYLVTDSRLDGKKCALKEMSDTAITTPTELQQAKEAFQREAKILSDLSHPVLPRVTDFFTQGNKHYLVMDYADGRPLDEILERRSRPFPVSQVVMWGKQICEVLTYLHNQTPPIIYRDLKPGNIMLAPDRMSLKLIDFGIARTFKPQRSKDTIAMGTPGYSPPEQYGKGQTDPRSDIYALGATLHHLLTLRDPGDDPFRFSKVRVLNPRVSPVVNHVIMKAVDQDRAKRWQSAEEMAKAFTEKPVHQNASRPVQNPLPKALKSIPAPSQSVSSKPIPIPSTPLASLAASFLSQSGSSKSVTPRIPPPTLNSPTSALNPLTKISVLQKLRNTYHWITNPKGWFTSLTIPSKVTWRDYLWVVLFGIGGIVLNILLENKLDIGSWGYSGEILGSILLSLPFLLSAIFVKKFGAAALTILLSNLFFSDLIASVVLAAVLSEMPFLATRYRKFSFLILFIAALLYGVGEYIFFALALDYYFPIDYIIKTWIVAFIGPLIVYLVGRLSRRL